VRYFGLSHVRVSNHEKKKGRGLPDLSHLRSAASASTSVVKDQRNNLCGLQVLGRALAVAVVLHELEAELLALGERTHACPLDSGDVDEYVRLAATLLDKAEALCRIEEFHGSSIHDDFLSIIHRKLPAAQDTRHTVQIDFDRRISPKTLFASETKFDSQDRYLAT
jgi:hypothetical protein